jgi:hypothetical protein
MRNLSMRIWALLAVLGASLLWNCRGKEGPQGPVGPQGPAGRDLTRSQEGYIRGEVKGWDTIRNQNFRIAFDYAYIPFWLNLPGYWQPVPGQPDTILIDISREGERGGSLYLNLYRQQSDGNTTLLYLSGEILNISGSSASRYYLSYPGYSTSDTAYVTNVQLRGDSLIQGTVYYIRLKGPNYPADTLKADFESRLLRLVPYQRLAQSSPFQTQSVQ